MVKHFLAGDIMDSILVKLFIKDYKNTSSESVRIKYGALASIFGIISNVVICVLKIIVGAFSGALSILADGINNLSDALNSIVALIGFKMSQKKADKEHPYGHQRMEYIAGFIVSVIVCVLGVELILEAVDKIKSNDTSVGYFYLNIVVLAFAIIVKLYQAILNRSIGKKINSQTLIATATDSRNDVISTSLVLIGLIISRLTGYSLDGYFGLAVGLLVCYSGIKLVIEASNPLIGEAPSKELVLEIEKRIKAHDDVLGIHDLEIHSYGPSIIFASCHVEVDSRGDLISLHDKIDQIEHEIKNELNVHLTIHLDPVLVGDKKTDEFREFTKSLLKENLSFSWSIHDFRIVSGPTHTNIIFDIIVPYGLKQTDAEIEDYIKKIIHDANNTFYAIVDIDHDYNDILPSDQ